VKAIEYGIESRNHKGERRYFIICDGQNIGIHFIKSGLAMEQAEKYARNCFKDKGFVSYTFRNMGIFNNYSRN
jgi:hypothetical protein